MSDTKNLLVELFVEELPPKALKKLGESFAETLLHSLKSQGLASDASVATSYASPRRLAAHVSFVAAQAADQSLSQKLMPVSVGLDANGNATPALTKKLSALGADASVVPRLRRESDGKTDVLFLDRMIPGATLADGLQKSIESALAALPIPKVMTYQLADGWSTVNFVRPAHGLVALHGAEVVPVSVLGLVAGHDTHGHRFEAKVDPITIKDADSYAQQLKNQGTVIASFAARREEIVRQLDAAAKKAGPNLTPVADDALLDEVTALVERPNVLIGQFEQAYLEVPQECLILTMKANQKYFPLLDNSGKLTNKFLIVSNINPLDASAVITGNERVVRPRLADAKFFFDQDRKKTLQSRIAGLAKVVYHNKLGSLGDRVNRVAQLARLIAPLLGVNPDDAGGAAMVAKADLMTDMVGEFPELQGVMGRYYALHDGRSSDIADAVEDHYKPRFAGDSLPRSRLGLVVALADKLETLTGMYAIGQAPTGEKDPFALRRHALGVIRILIEGQLSLNLVDLIGDAKAYLPPEIRETADSHYLGTMKDALLAFISERLRYFLRDSNYAMNEIDAVLSLEPTFIDSVPKKLAAVRAFAALPEAAALAAANKRVGNILKKVEGTVEAKVDSALLIEPAEKALGMALAHVKPKADIAFMAGDYTASLQALAALREPVDKFFTDVMVNVDDEKLRNNRLGLLATLHQAMNQVADISKL
jgi:glycyl-tRNA synthetase beta chain